MDALSRALGLATDRRGALRAAFGSLGALGLSVPDGQAKKKKKKKKRRPDVCNVACLGREMCDENGCFFTYTVCKNDACVQGSSDGSCPLFYRIDCGGYCYDGSCAVTESCGRISGMTVCDGGTLKCIPERSCGG